MYKTYLTFSLLRSQGSIYIPLLLVMLIVGSLILGEMNLLHLERKKSQEQELLSIGHEYRRAIQSYYHFQNKKIYPFSIEELLEDPRGEGYEIIRHMRKIYPDPITGKKEWTLLKINSRIVGFSSTSEKNPLKKSNFSQEDQSFENSTRYNQWIFSYLSEQILEENQDFLDEISFHLLEEIK